MQVSLQSRNGMALIMALGAMVIIGVLIGGIVFVTTQDYRIGTNTMRQEQFQDRDRTARNSMIESGLAFPVLCLDVRTVLEQRSNRRGIAAHRRVGDWRIAGPSWKSWNGRRE